MKPQRNVTIAIGEQVLETDTFWTEEFNEEDPDHWEVLLQNLAQFVENTVEELREAEDAEDEEQVEWRDTPWPEERRHDDFSPEWTIG